MSVIEPHELGEFQSFKVVDFLANQLDSLLVEVLTTAEEQPIDATLSIPKQHRHLSVSNVLRAGQVGQISQLINEQVNPDIRADLQPFYVLIKIY